MDKVTTRQDRIVGLLLLTFAIVVLLAPRLEFAGRPDSNYLIGSAWLCAAILLLSMDSAARPMPKLIRWAAVILFVMGLVGPFAANLIDQSLGA